MWKLKLIDSLFLSISAALLLGWISTTSSFATDSHHPDQILSSLQYDQTTPTLASFSTNTLTSTPEATKAINLPIIQQDASLQTSIPQVEGEITPLPSITPTPVPPQSMEENVPIVFGAIVIVVIIIFAWIIVGRRIYTRKH